MYICQNLKGAKLRSMSTTTVNTIHPGDLRGHTQIDWLDSYHTFSFSNFHDPNRIGFRSLRVINDDYATERDNVLREPQVELVPPQIFYEYLKQQGKIGGQAKFPRVMKKETFAEWEKFVAGQLIRL